jgi:tetratricopeptide (TPR) repeat protein
MRAQWLAIVGLAAVNFSAVRADTPAAQLEKGIFQQETAGDLDAAVKVYKQIVDEANANRRFVAEAQFRIGECYQKQGKKAEAEAAFRQVVVSYPDQVELVAKARKELGEAEPARAPKIVRTSPLAFANDVSPALDKITVTFDQEMEDGCWAWVNDDYLGSYPKTRGKPYYDAARTTCTLPCTLEPGKVYWVGINEAQFTGFSSVSGIPAPSYVILFATQSAEGKPTPIPEEACQEARRVSNTESSSTVNARIRNMRDTANAKLLDLMWSMDMEDFAAATAQAKLAAESVKDLLEAVQGTKGAPIVKPALDKLVMVCDMLEKKDFVRAKSLWEDLNAQSPAIYQAFKDALEASHVELPARAVVPTVPAGVTRLSYVKDRSEARWSLGGSGHAVLFERTAEKATVTAVQIFASRYGTSVAPTEDFHVYLLNEDRTVIGDFHFPYSTIERTVAMRWYNLLMVPPAAVPQKFYVALDFNPTEYKGIYLGLDSDISISHSFVGLPTKGYKLVDKNFDWMVRPVLATGKNDNAAK